MELMTVNDAKKLVAELRRIYGNDADDMRILLASKYITVKDANGYFTIGDLDKELDKYKGTIDRHFACVVIDGTYLLNRYTVHSISDINIHCMIEDLEYNINIER